MRHYNKHRVATYLQFYLVSHTMHWIFFLFLGYICNDDSFIAFDCSSPKNTEFFDHKVCHKHSDRLIKKNFVVVQQREVDQTSGYSCSGSYTSTTGYCGTYAHSKFTGQDNYQIPIIFTQESCRKMAEEKVYDTGTQTLPINIGSINNIKAFSHGSVSFSGSNIACTGGEMRLDNGDMNTNMLQQIHFRIQITPTNLIIVKDEVIDPYTQITLGPFSAGYAGSYSTMFIWTPARPPCDKLKVMDTMLESANNDIWYSDHHQIQIRTLDSFYDQNCKIKLLKTDAPGLFLSTSQVELKSVTEKDIDISIDSLIKFEYTNGKIQDILKNSYKNRHPMCSKINDNPLDAITRIGDTTFLRNLGEVSVQFSCNKLEVAPVLDEVCHSMLKVRDHKGSIWFLEAVTRLLFSTSVIIPCESARVPVYRTTGADLVMYSPDRRLITTTGIPEANTTSTSPEAPGIYSLQMVKSWLQFAWLQHLNKHSYSFISQAICQDSSCQDVHRNPSQLFDLLGSAVHKATKIIGPSFWMGIDIEQIGRRCSIAVCALVVIYAVYWFISFFLRCAMFRGDNISCLALAIRSTFPQLFLIAKSTGTEENKNSA